MWLSGSCRVALLVAVVGVSSVASNASAQRIEGKTNLRLGVGVIAYSSLTIDPEAAGFDDETSTITGFGLLDSATLTVGYGVSDTVVIQCGLDVAHQTTSPEEGDDNTESMVGLIPGIQYVFPGDAARFYLMGGFEVASGVTDNGTFEISTMLFGPVVGLGGHFFVGDTATISPSLTFGYVTGSMEVDNGGGDNAEASVSGFTIQAGLDVGVWM